MAIHNTLGNNATESHGPLWQTVANNAALVALTIAAGDVSQRKLILQTDTGQLWVCTAAGTPGTFQEVARTATTLDAFAAPVANVAMNAKKLTGLAAGTASGDSVRYDEAVVTAGTHAFTANQSLGGFALTNVADPTNPQDAETKNHADSRLQTLAGWSMLSAPATTSVRFVDFNNVRDVPQPAEQSSVVVMPFACTVAAMYTFHFTPLTPDTLTYTLRKNGVDTTVTYTVAGGGTSQSITGQALSVAAGDRLSMKVVQSSTTAQAALGSITTLAFKSSSTG